MILFLDFDGVLHPDEAYLIHGRPVLRAEGELFMWAPLLVNVLADFPNVRIVLSTSWARDLRFTRARNWLPEVLRARVIGATWHSGMAQNMEGFGHLRLTWWDRATRYQQIRRYVDRANLADWVAIDDQPEGWVDADSDHLFQTDGNIGLSDPAVLEKLAARLRANALTEREGLIMLHTEQQLQTVAVGFTCDRCGTTVTKNDNAFEHQEGHHIAFTGGYGSVFGDGARVECDICQDCLKELIGAFCRVTSTTETIL